MNKVDKVKINDKIRTEDNIITVDAYEKKSWRSSVLSGSWLNSEDSLGVPAFTFKMRTNVSYVEVMTLIGLYMEHFSGKDEDTKDLNEYWRRYDAEMNVNRALVSMFSDIDVEGLSYDDLVRYDIPNTICDNLQVNIWDSIDSAVSDVYNTANIMNDIRSEFDGLIDYVTKNVSDESFEELSKQVSGLKEIDVNSGKITKEEITKVLPKKRKKKLN